MSQERLFRELPMGTQIHCFPCYSSGCFMEYPHIYIFTLAVVWVFVCCLVGFGVFLIALLFCLRKKHRLCIPLQAETQGNLVSVLSFQGLESFFICGDIKGKNHLSVCSRSAQAPLCSLTEEAVGAAVASWHADGCIQLVSDCAYAKINHFLMLITFCPSKTS